MGWKSSDLSPSQFSSITPAAKDVRVKVFQVSRSDTVQTTKMYLPANSSLVEAVLVVAVTANSQTSDIVSVGMGTTTNNVIASQTVTALTVFRNTLPTVMAAVEGTFTGDIPITAIYTGVGTAATTGGPWTVMVKYVN